MNTVELTDEEAQFWIQCQKYKDIFSFIINNDGFHNDQGSIEVHWCRGRLLNDGTFEKNPTKLQIHGTKYPIDRNTVENV